MAKDMDLSFLKERYVKDLSKPDVDKFERAAIIQSLLDEKGWSQRRLGKEYGVPHSTVQDWLLHNAIPEKEYNALVEKGFTPTVIYRNLREKKRKQEASGVVGTVEIDVWLVETRNNLRKYKKELPFSPKTMTLIDETVNELNSYGAAINVKQKNRK